jgi:HSP20 family protein
MALIRYQTRPSYNPIASFIDLRDEMDRLFTVAAPVFAERFHAFPVDLYHDKDAFFVRAELPGFRKEDVNVAVEDGVLTIVAEDKGAEKEASVAALRSVTRSLSLPDAVATDKIEARYENGVLQLTLPKREEIKPKQIAVEVK